MGLYNGNTDACSDCRTCAGAAENCANGTAGTCPCADAATGESAGALNPNTKELLVFAAIVMLLVALLYRSSGAGQ